MPLLSRQPKPLDSLDAVILDPGRSVLPTNPEGVLRAGVARRS